jgi:divalent metal cation (Fe/Co/Zn/Cd) transporter
MSIGVLLAAVAFLVAYEVKSMLVGESASRQVRSEIRAAVLSHPNVESIGRLLTMHMGPKDIVVNLDVDFQEGLTMNQVEASIDEIESAVRSVAPNAGQIFVEVESAR